MRQILSVFLLFFFSGGVALSAKPNFLLILADDCSYRDLGVYGGQAKTPHLDKLAGEGMKFNRCFQAAPMCSPTRHNLYTGLYPVKSGAHPNHAMAYDWVKSIAHYLQAANYTTHLAGKTHILPESVFPFQYGSKDGPDPRLFEKVLKSSTVSGQPFLYIGASHQPHEPWDKGDPSQYPPTVMKLGRVNRDLISCADFLPTICEAARIPIPAGGDGVSFLPQLRGEKGSPRDSLYIWYSPRQQLDLTVEEFAFDHHHKLTRTGQFFDLQADPDERSALANLNAHQAAAKAKLQSILDQYQDARPASLDRQFQEGNQGQPER